jgi:hypothetical protein
MGRPGRCAVLTSSDLSSLKKRLKAGLPAFCFGIGGYLHADAAAQPNGSLADAQGPLP